MGEVSKPHSRDYIERTIATVRNHADADNSWPQWANVFADEIERLWNLEEQVETLTGRNQFLSTEQVRADVCEASFRELSVNFESKVDELRSVEEQLATAQTALRRIAEKNLVPHWTTYQHLESCREVAVAALRDSNPASSPDGAAGA